MSETHAARTSEMITKVFLDDHKDERMVKSIDRWTSELVARVRATGIPLFELNIEMWRGAALALVLKMLFDHTPDEMPMLASAKLSGCSIDELKNAEKFILNIIDHDIYKVCPDML